MQVNVTSDSIFLSSYYNKKFLFYTKTKDNISTQGVFFSVYIYVLSDMHDTNV